MAARKTLYEELQLHQRFSELTPKYFKFLNEVLDSDDKNNKKWACEQLTKVLSRAIPQVPTDDDGNVLIKIIGYGNNIAAQLPAEELSTTAIGGD